MVYCTNPAVDYLLRHSYGQGGTVSVPTRDTTSPGLPASIKGRFPAGVQDVLGRLVDVYAAWTASADGAPLEWCIFVGGPGNGKSEALRDLAGALQVALPNRQGGEPAPRTVPPTWPGRGASVVPGLEIAFINDASVPRQDAQGERRTGSLFLDLRDGAQKLFSAGGPALVVFANVNRGILVEECKALEAISDDRPAPLAAEAIIRWLADPRAPLEDFRVDVNVTVPVTPSSPFYGQLQVGLKKHGASHDVVVHAVFLDTLSLLEPSPGSGTGSIDFTASPPTPAPYQPLGGLADDASSRIETIAGDLTRQVVDEAQWDAQGCRAHGSGALCEAHSLCPFAQNARWLRDKLLVARFLDTLRAAELAGGRRFAYRDLLGHLGLAVIGTPEQSWLTDEHPCRWVERTVRDARNGNGQNAAELASHRVYANLFPITDPLAWPKRRPLADARAYRVVASTMRAIHDAPRVRTFEQAFNLIDPARDADPWDGLRATILDMVEALDVSAPATEIARIDGWVGAASSEIERQLDATVPGEVNAELGGGKEAVGRAHLLRKWRAVLLLRQAGLALGWLPHKNIVQNWLREHQAALSNRPPGDLRLGLNNLVLPGKADLNLAPFRPRTMDLGKVLPPSSVLVSLPERDVRLELVAEGDTLSAELRLSRRGGGGAQVVARLPIDLRVAREALLNVEGPSGSFTEIGEAAFARIERARAALVSDRFIGSARLLISNSLGRAWEVIPPTAGASAFRIQSRSSGQS